MSFRPSRRQVLKVGAGATAGMATSVLPPALLRALAQPAPQCGVLPDIEHVVIMIQENRSFDHYFGRYPGVNGFSDRRTRLSPNDDGSTIFKQANIGLNVPNPVLPFHISTTNPAGTPNGTCIHDIGHQWVEQHLCWHNGTNDAFVKTHVDPVEGEGPQAGPLTMGYYQREDLPFYWELADNFTICDNYFTSVISGTVSNRIYGLTGMLDPDGLHGGPVINTPEGGNQQDYQNLYSHLDWNTYPEVLEGNSISWKVYSALGDLAVPVFNDNYLVFFKQYLSNANLFQRAFAPQYPNDFLLDCATGNLPTVSWLIPEFLTTEHPPTPTTWGEFTVGQALEAVASNPDLWAKTAFLLTWDDSGGFFDHVIPPYPSNPNEPGEHLTKHPPVGTDGNIMGPIGLGFRVPNLVISPFSRNPLPKSDPNWQPMVCSDLFDHTSILRFLRELLVSKGKNRAGVELPYDTTWRRSKAGGTGVGDLTSAFNFAGGNRPAPNLTYPSVADFAQVLNPLTHPECILAPNTELPSPQPAAYPIPLNVTSITAQDPGTARRPSGLVSQAACFPKVTTPSAEPGSLPNTLAGNAVAGLPLAAASLAGGAALAAGWWARRVRENREAEDSKPG